jgi:hypothetical protein
VLKFTWARPPREAERAWAGRWRLGGVPDTVDETRMKINGGGHCGFITYEARVDPNGVTICHSTGTRQEV